MRLRVCLIFVCKSLCALIGGKSALFEGPGTGSSELASCALCMGNCSTGIWPCCEETKNAELSNAKVAWWADGGATGVSGSESSSSSVSLGSPLMVAVLGGKCIFRLTFMKSGL